MRRAELYIIWLFIFSLVLALAGCVVVDWIDSEVSSD
jgi:hypothetical protein